MRLKGWRAHRCILLLHVIFVLLLETGSQIALRRNHRGREEMEASDSDPTLGRETAAQQMCPQKQNKKTKQSWSWWNTLVDFWFTLSDTSKHDQSHMFVLTKFILRCVCVKQDSRPSSPQHSCSVKKGNMAFVHRHTIHSVNTVTRH